MIASLIIVLGVVASMMLGMAGGYCMAHGRRSDATVWFAAGAWLASIVGWNFR